MVICRCGQVIFIQSSQHVGTSLLYHIILFKACFDASEWKGKTQKPFFLFQPMKRAKITIQSSLWRTSTVHLLLLSVTLHYALVQTCSHLLSVSGKKTEGKWKAFLCGCWNTLSVVSTDYSLQMFIKCCSGRSSNMSSGKFVASIHCIPNNNNKVQTITYIH